MNQPATTPVAPLADAGEAGLAAGSTSPRKAGAGDRVPLLAWLIGLAFVAIELAISSRYGFMQDELYFLVAGHHLAFGYVDQPPIAPLLTRITDVVGVSPTAIRIVPALAGGLVVVAAARFAALFGAGRLGRVLAALATACSPALLGADHVANTTSLDLLAWSAVLLCVTTALVRNGQRWWIGAGIAAGIGLEADNLVAMLVLGIGLGLLFSVHRPVLRTAWPWAGAAIALVLWAPNLIWQATHGWPQLAMASAIHHQNNSPGNYAGGIPAQFLYVGVLVAPLVVAGFVVLWRAPELRFIAIAATLTVVYVLAWVPGKVYYSDGVMAVVLAAGSAAAERWVARGRRLRLRHGLVVAAPLVGGILLLPFLLPIVPTTAVHSLPKGIQQSSTVGDTIGWPQLTHAVVAEDSALSRAGQTPTSIFTGYYAEAGALDVFGTGDHLPPVLSGHNSYWWWGPGRASDRTVLVVDALGQLRPYFRDCRLLTTWNPPYHVQNNWTGIQIGLCTGPTASWQALWPHLRLYA